MNRVITTIENTLACGSFIVITIIAFANVMSRYLLNASLAFTTELVVNLAVWLTMIGAVIGIRENAHLGFTALHESLKGTARNVLTVIVGVAMVVFLLVLVWYGLDLVMQQADRNRLTPSMRIPQWLFTVALPLCGVFGIIRAVQATWDSLRGKDAEDSLTEGRAIA